MLTVITTTRDRPLCFSILEKWMERQTYKDELQWLVVNDSPKGMKDYTYNQGQDVHYRRAKKKELHSLCENWLAAIPRIKGDRVIVWEDDDYYHPEYLATLSKLLDEKEVCGFHSDVYFNLRLKKFRRCHNLTHASLAATGFRASVLPRLKEIARRGGIFLDMALWDEMPEEGKKLADNKAPDGRMYHVGMKGMPGLPGTGFGHGAEGSSDGSLTFLTQWVGMPDSRVYRQIPAAAWGAPAK